MDRLLGPPIFLACAGLLLANSALAGDREYDSPMYRDPVIPVPGHVITFAPGILSMWLQALERPEVDLRCRAALAIAAARRLGLRDTDRAIAPLIRVLEKPGQDEAVRLAVAQALIELDARDAAASLWAQAESGNHDLRNLIEPALARWNFQGARAAWLKRLDQVDVDDRSLLLAIRGLGMVRVAEAVPDLRRWVHQADAPATIRVEAARALDSIRPAELEKDASRLLAGGTNDLAARIAAVTLLSHAQTPAAVKLLQQMLRDPEPAVVRIAVVRLNQIDPRTVIPVVDRLLKNPEAEVRLAAIEALAREITVPRLQVLADRCLDPHPQVRAEARRRLGKLASRADLQPVILKLATGLLEGSDWRGQEQAALLLGQLGHRPAGARLLVLLNSHRPEVCLASAWGLREIGDPKTLPSVFDYVRDVHTDIQRPDGSIPDRLAVVPVFDAQISQLVQFLGKARYRRADPLLRKFLPRRPTPGSRPPVAGEARAAAVWALGLLHDSQPDPVLAKVFETRLLSVFTPRGGDDPRVLRMFPIALARMHARNSVSGLRRFYQEASAHEARNACAWALAQLTGQAVAPVPPIARAASGWFLSPLWKVPAPAGPRPPPG